MNYMTPRGIKLPVSIHKALHADSSESASEKVRNLITRYAKGEIDIQDEKEEKVGTSLLLDPEILKEADKKLKADGLSFNKAVALLIQKHLMPTEHRRHTDLSPQ